MQMAWDLTSRIIEGNKIRLEPLSENHIVELCECLLGEPDGWFSRMYGINSTQVLSGALANRLKANGDRKSVSFVSRDKSSGKVAGISHFMRIDEPNRQLEIGGTQVGRHFRKTHVNTENKFLMLREAFERLCAVRVFFKVDTENIISQQGVLRIGAKLEGEFRNDAILPDGRVRNYLIYSIVDSEWGGVKARLQSLMDRTAPTQGVENLLGI